MESAQLQLEKFYGLVSACSWADSGKPSGFKLFCKGEAEYFFQKSGVIEDFSKFEKHWVFVRGHLVDPHFIEVHFINKAIRKKRGLK